MRKYKTVIKTVSKINECICDKCGKQCTKMRDEDGNLIDYRISINLNYYYSHIEEEPLILDLCPDCAKELLDWFPSYSEAREFGNNLDILKKINKDDLPDININDFIEGNNAVYCDTDSEIKRILELFESNGCNWIDSDNPNIIYEATDFEHNCYLNGGVCFMINNLYHNSIKHSSLEYCQEEKYKIIDSKRIK